MNKKYSGSMLMTALALVFISSFLLIVTLENLTLNAKFSLNSGDYYTGKILASLFLTEVKRYEYPLKAEETIDYNVGKITYTYKDETLNLVVTIKNKEISYTFRERIHQNERKKIE